MIWGEYRSRLCSNKITRSPKVPNYEIQGAQHKSYMKEIRLSGHPKAKVSRLRNPGTLRAQPCRCWMVVFSFDLYFSRFLAVFRTCDTYESNVLHALRTDI